MLTTLTIVRYRGLFVPFAVLAMAVFRIPLFLNKHISFYKLMGSGRNGTFDRRADWRQWAILAVHRSVPRIKGEGYRFIIGKGPYGLFIKGWLRFFRCETWTVILEPIEGHGTWDKKEAFGRLSRQSDYEGPIAVLTRATIRRRKAKAFWSHVDAVAARMRSAPGFINSFGIGDTPWLRQATFSIWDSKESMKQFAYNSHEHKEVIVKTRKDDWYSEDLFVRFRIIYSSGSIKGQDPLSALNNSAKFAGQ